MAFGIPDFGEIEAIGKNLTKFMSDVRNDLETQSQQLDELSDKMSDINGRIATLINTIEGSK